MNDAGFFCKSYAGDFSHLEHLLISFTRHNPDDLVLTLSLPRSDIGPFRQKFGNVAHVEIVADEAYCGRDLKSLPGWHGQQVCKLMSSGVVAAAHYAVLDSDCYFIRDVRAVDILPRAGFTQVACGSSIRTVFKADSGDLAGYLDGTLVIDASRFPAPPETVIDRLDEFVHYRELSQDNPGAVERSDIPFKSFGSRRWLFYQPGQIFSASLLEQLAALLRSHGLDFVDAIIMCPWEYNWYGEFAATHGHDGTDFRISPFIHFQDATDLRAARDGGITVERLSRRFSWIQMAAGHIDDLTF